jgi:hypothetical protein
MVYGWASVVTEKGEPVVDRQGDVIEPDTLVKAVNNFMEHVRVGKAMHVGEQVGVLFTLCQSLKRLVMLSVFSLTVKDGLSHTKYSMMLSGIWLSLVNLRLSPLGAVL